MAGGRDDRVVGQESGVTIVTCPTPIVSFRAIVPVYIWGHSQRGNLTTLPIPSPAWLSE